MTKAILATLAAIASGVSISIQSTSTGAQVQEANISLAQDTVYPLTLKPCQVCANGHVCIVNDEDVPMVYFYHDTADDMTRCRAMLADDCANRPEKYRCP